MAEHRAVRADGGLHVPHGGHGPVGAQRVGEPVARLLPGGCGRIPGAVGQVCVPSVGALGEPFPGVGAQVDDVAHVVLDDAGHRDASGGAGRVSHGVLPGQRQVVARAHAQCPGGLLGDEHRVRAERHGPVSDSFAKVDGAGQASGVAGDDHLHGQVVGAGALRQHGSRIHARQALRAAVDERAPHPPGRGVVEAARDGDGHVIALDLAELDVDDVPDRVVQAEADEHQRRARPGSRRRLRPPGPGSPWPRPCRTGGR